MVPMLFAIAKPLGLLPSDATPYNPSSWGVPPLVALAYVPEAVLWQTIDTFFGLLLSAHTNSAFNSFNRAARHVMDGNGMRFEPPE